MSAAITAQSSSEIRLGGIRGPLARSKIRSADPCLTVGEPLWCCGGLIMLLSTSLCIFSPGDLVPCPFVQDVVAGEGNPSLAVRFHCQFFLRSRNAAGARGASVQEQGGGEPRS